MSVRRHLLDATIEGISAAGTPNAQANKRAMKNESILAESMAKVRRDAFSEAADNYAFTDFSLSNMQQGSARVGCRIMLRVTLHKNSQNEHFKQFRKKSLVERGVCGSRARMR